MTRFQKALPWLYGIGIATLLMGALALFSGLQYTGNDDAPILRAAMGYTGGEPTSYLLHTHMAFTWLLYGLAKLFPGVAWFSILQLFLLWISQVVIVKSLCQTAQRKGFPLWLGAAFAAVFLGAFTLYITTRITYTVTAALCGAAAVAQLLDTDFSAKRRSVYLGGLGAAALLLACFFLRMSAVVPSVCFFLLLWASKWLSARSRQGLVLLGIIAVLFAASAGAQLLDIRVQGVQEDLSWHDKRIALFDYTGFTQEVPDETLTAIGWTRDELQLVENWFFLNDNITAEAFQTLIDQQTAAQADHASVNELQAAWQAVQSTLREPKLLFLLLCMLAAALAALLSGSRASRLTLLFALMGGFVLLFLLGYMGRLNIRAAYSVLLPMGTAVFMLAAEGGIPRIQWRKIAATAALLACVPLAAYAGVAQMNAAYIPPDPNFTDTTSDLHADLDEIALQYDDMLILYDLSLAQDHRLFPDTAEGIPRNLLLWGGWMAHSVSWRNTLSRFEIDTLDPSLFLRDTVLYASTYAEPPQDLLRYIAQGADGTVDWTYYDQWGYVNLFEFDVY